MGSIYLIRHGQAAASWEQDSDPGLSEIGRRQSQELLVDLRSRPIQRVLSSPMKRARETAQPLLGSSGLDLEIVDAFREIPTPAGVPIAERLEWLKGCSRQSWATADSLLLSWRDDLLKKLRQLDGEGVAVFTHFMVMNAVMGSFQSDSVLVCYQPAYCSVLSITNDGGELSLVYSGRESSTRVL